jgi:hypothetical protein
MATQFFSDDYNLKLELSNDHDKKIVTIDNSNANQIQIIKLRGPDVSLTVEGKGIVYYQVIRRYRNSDGSDEMKAFTDSCGGGNSSDSDSKIDPKDDENTGGKGDSGYVLYIVIGVLLVLAGAGAGFFVFKKKSVRSNESVAYKRPGE